MPQITLSGGEFLLKDQQPHQVFTPRDFSAEHRAIAAMAHEFFANEVEPNIAALQHKDRKLLVEILRKSAELGLTGISIPEEYGGLALDLASVLIVEEAFARDASYMVTHGGQAGIGALPLVFFGNAEQKARYLPKLASAEMIAAYALSEPEAGSDAMALRTRAELSADGRHYILKGQKMWITNGGLADLVTVFAKVNGEQFTAFLVERKWSGVNIGNEEEKMGLHGSSTTAVYLDNVAAPVANVLGTVGRGHIIAFNVLNIGRLKIGAYGAGAGKEILSLSLAYAKSRKAFGTTLSAFGAIQRKLADMAILVFVIEAMTWRVVGLIQDEMNRRTGSELTAIEEYALECSIVKVFASEAIGKIADEGVQIHGGYGYHHDYAVERFYRDVRIFRVFEGTNEINRQIIVSMLLKRHKQGRLDLFGLAPENPWKRLALDLIQAAFTAYGDALADQQEVLVRLADIMIDVFALESCALRALRLQETPQAEAAQNAEAVFRAEAGRRMWANAGEILSACGSPAAAHSLSFPMDTIARRHALAARMLESGRYPFTS